MTLTGPESVILEQGIEGATITSYTFTVPPVTDIAAGLSECPRVQRADRAVGSAGLRHNHNGITFSRSLPPGLYSRLESTTTQIHDCMYNKSNYHLFRNLLFSVTRQFCWGKEEVL
jgi:hypothetical protein